MGSRRERQDAGATFRNTTWPYPSPQQKRGEKCGFKRQMMGREVVVAVTNGTLDFGPWERIFYGEFDGRRRKRVLVKVIGE